MPSLASIVIPAHNEERRIRGLLEALSDPAISGIYDIYAVCNGCSDLTREVAEEYPGIIVVEIPDAGKHFALNEGDRLAGDVYPRLYCDADTLVAASCLKVLVDLLTSKDVKAAGPRVRYGVEKSAWAVKMYFRALDSPLMISWLDQHLTGRGLYGASRAARERFESFPPMFADDLFFDSQFELSEKEIASDCVVTIWVPVKLRALLSGEVRVREGNQQFIAAFQTSSVSDDPELGTPPRSRDRSVSRLKVLRDWWRDLRGRDVVPLTVYLGVNYTAKLLLFVKKKRGHEIRWR
jgi:hypothetical protein